VLSILRSELCTCGCNQKIAECRMKDESCSASRRLANFVIQGASAGKTAAMVREELKKYADQPPPVLEKPVKLYTEGDPVRGPANAKVTVVEFSDFQCPYCALATGEVRELLKQYPKDVKLVFKQFPLDNHSQAALAAEASLAAHAQGKFWELHDKMFTNQAKLAVDDLKGYAKSLGMDAAKFDKCLDSGEKKPLVEEDLKAGSAVGVNGTPAFFINGLFVNGAQPYEQIKQTIDRELQRKG
jgi:protein-disulfide isomerase